MTTKELATLKKLLLAELPGFASKGRLIFILPVKHILRGINFDPSAFDKKSFTATAFMMPLFVPSDHLTLNFGDRVRNKGNGDRWNMDAPGLSTELSNALRQKSVPFLSSIESLKDFIKAAQKSLIKMDGPCTPNNNPHTIQAVAYAFILTGEFQQAHDTLVQLLRQLDLKIPWQQVMAKRAQALMVELQAHPSAAQSRLENWEAQTIKNLGLDRFK